MAPSVQTMLNNFGGDYTKAATAYCGLEVEITTPSGVTKTAYIVDGFAAQVQNFSLASLRRVR